MTFWGLFIHVYILGTVVLKRVLDMSYHWCILLDSTLPIVCMLINYKETGITLAEIKGSKTPPGRLRHVHRAVPVLCPIIPRHYSCNPSESGPGVPSSDAGLYDYYRGGDRFNGCQSGHCGQRRKPAGKGPAAVENAYDRKGEALYEASQSENYQYDNGAGDGHQYKSGSVCCSRLCNTG